MGGGVIYFKNNPDEIRNVFEYAKDTGLPTMICSPDPDALDATEKMAKEYNVRIAIHNMARGQKISVTARCAKDGKGPRRKDGDLHGCRPHGAHWRRSSGGDQEMRRPFVRLSHERCDGGGAQRKSYRGGRGIIDIPGVLKALLKLKWPYHVALEHELNATAPMPGVIESFAYMRGVLAALD